MNGSADRTTSRTGLAKFGAVLIGSALGHPVSATPQYSVTDLGTFGGDTSEALGINDRGEVVGYALSADQTKHAFRSAPHGRKPTLTYFGNPKERYSEGVAINSAGQIAVIRFLSEQSLLKLAKKWQQKGGIPKSITVVGASLGLRSTPNGTRPRLSIITPPHLVHTQTALGRLSELDVSNLIFGINDRGQIAGSADFGSPLHEHAFRSTGNFTDPVLTDLGTLGGRTSLASGINNHGQVAGTSAIGQLDSYSSEIRHAFRSTGNGKKVRLVDLGTLGGSISYGQGINDSGQVAGYAQLSDLSLHAFRSSGNGENVGLNDLGTLGGRNSYGQAINSKGYVVGTSNIAMDNEPHAFLYDGELHDLNELIVGNSGWTVTLATGINNRNEISANGVDVNGRRHALLLAPMSGDTSNRFLAE